MESSASDGGGGGNDGVIDGVEETSSGDELAVAGVDDGVDDTSDGSKTMIVLLGVEDASSAMIKVDDVKERLREASSGDELATGSVEEGVEETYDRSEITVVLLGVEDAYVPSDEDVSFTATSVDDGVIDGVDDASDGSEIMGVLLGVEDASSAVMTIDEVDDGVDDTSSGDELAIAAVDEVSDGSTVTVLLGVEVEICVMPLSAKTLDGDPVNKKTNASAEKNIRSRRGFEAIEY